MHQRFAFLVRVDADIDRLAAAQAQGYQGGFSVAQLQHRPGLASPSVV